MPVKGSKRAAAAPAPAAKKAKVDPAVKAVCEAVEQAVSLSEPCRKMLLAGLPHAFATAREERHAVQQQIVDMVGEALEGVHAALAQELEAEAGKVAEVEGRRQALQQAVDEAKETVAAAAADVERKSEALGHATEGALSAKGTLQEKQEMQTAGDAELVKAKDSKAALERGIEENLRAILEATAESPKLHFEKLLPLLENLALDASLMNTLPSVCAKKATERGSFDTMVLEQLAQSLRDRAANLAKVVDEALPAAETRAAAVREAQAAAEAAAAAQAAASEELSAASAARQAAEAALATAEAAVAAFEPEYEQATSVRDECQSKLDNFKGYHIGNFELLRDRAAAPSATVGGA